MYTDIGMKIKNLTKTIFIIQAVVYFILGIVLAFMLGEFSILGILTGGILILFSWISTWLLYGFGEIVDRICKIEERMNPQIKVTVKQAKNAPAPASAPAPQPAPESKASSDEVYDNLLGLLALGRITEEEFNDALSKLQQ